MKLSGKIIDLGKTLTYWEILIFQRIAQNLKITRNWYNTLSGAHGETARLIVNYTVATGVIQKHNNISRQ
jgi:hypothetical protein